MPQGLEQGLERGRQDEAVRLVVRQLRKKLGSLPPSVTLKLSRLSLTLLEQLGEELLEFLPGTAGQQQLKSWLAAKPNLTQTT